MAGGQRQCEETCCAGALTNSTGLIVKILIGGHISRLSMLQGREPKVLNIFFTNPAR